MRLDLGKSLDRDTHTDHESLIAEPAAATRVLH